ncbi:GNAT family N-acetyltransferase [Brevundimonas sp.]|uniref:GNAT family N-acetyltransferase n=1 Tax=Brevundimonas sp. TaxID=1871086 RepID=UPI00391C3182
MEFRGRPAEHPLPPLSNRLSWRPMLAGDLDAVVEIAGLGFPDHFEGRDCFENRLALSPDGCFVLAGADGAVKGYLVAYPWRAQDAPALDTLIEAIPADADVLYLHDLALHPDARGGGWTGPIIEQLARSAKAAGWPAIALVAVNDAAPFWEKRGFTVVKTAEMATKLAGYGPAPPATWSAGCDGLAAGPALTGHAVAEGVAVLALAGGGAAGVAGGVERLGVFAVPGQVVAVGVDDGDAGRGHQAGGDGGENDETFHGTAPEEWRWRTPPHLTLKLGCPVTSTSGR